MTNYQQVSTTQQASSEGQRQFTFQASQLIWLFLGLVESLFALRILLKLMGANPANPFAALLYSVTGVFLVPFAGLIGTPALGSMQLEISTVIAMVVYALLGWVLERIVWVIFYRPRGAATVTQTTVIDKRTP